MGTSSVDSTKSVVTALREAGIPFALLHGADSYARGLIDSDLDIMLRDSPTGAINAIRSILEARGISLIFVWNSDRGTVNTFWWSTREVAGCQIDMLFDPEGRNRFGFKTEPAWRFVDADVFPPRLVGDGLATYLAAKRISKGQYSQYKALRRSGDRIASDLLRPRTRFAMRALKTRRGVVTFGVFTRLQSRGMRLGRRLTRRQGVIVAGSGPALTRRLCEVLPRVRRVRRASATDRLRASVLPEVVVVDSPNEISDDETIQTLSRLAWSDLSREPAQEGAA